MITKQELDSAIAECQGDPNPNAQTCLKLASYFTINDHLFGTEKPAEVVVSAPETYSREDRYSSETEFGQAVSKRNPSELMPLMDELMTTISVLQPRLYKSVMRRLED